MTGAAARSWQTTPVGLLVLDRSGTVIDANATFLSWLGEAGSDVVGRARLSQLLTTGGRIYWETHLAPMLHADGRIDEVAVEVRTPSGRRPVLLSAVATETGEAHVALSSARERSRYERELLAASRAAERAAERTQLLQSITSALSAAVGYDGVTAALLRQTVGALNVPAATVWLPDGEHLRPYASRGEALDAAVPPGPALDDVRSVGDRVEVPLRGHATLRGVLSLSAPTGAGGEHPDLDVFAAVGQQAGIALDRAAMYEEKASLAHVLQRSLLDVAPPRDPRFAVTTVYRPGVAGLEVGGDFFDAFLVEEDRLAVAVGDVVGRGLEAATAMGRLRSAMRALAARGEGPARVLSGLDPFVAQVPGAASATLAYAEVTLTSGRTTFACAGHLPPLLRPAGGGARLVWEGRSAPLGVHGTRRTEAELLLAPGDRLLLYTDGLVERRERGLREGLTILTSTADEDLRLPDAEAVDALTNHLLADDCHRDDVCVLLLSWSAVNPAPRD